MLLPASCRTAGGNTNPPRPCRSRTTEGIANQHLSTMAGSPASRLGLNRPWRCGRLVVVVVGEQRLWGGASTIGPTFPGADFTAAEQRDLGIGQTLDHRQDQHL